MDTENSLYFSQQSTRAPLLEPYRTRPQPVFIRYILNIIYHYIRVLISLFQIMTDKCTHTLLKYHYINLMCFSPQRAILKKHDFGSKRNKMSYQTKHLTLHTAHYLRAEIYRNYFVKKVMFY